MKSWTASNVPPAPSKQPNWKAIVRRLRDWLDSLLDEGGATRAAGQHVSDAVPVRTSSPLPDEQDQRSVLPNYDSEEEKAKVARWNALRQQPPPEDWLRRVREGAPELLRSVEERQALTSGGPQPGTESGDAPCEMRSMSPPSPALGPERANGADLTAREARQESPNDDVAVSPRFAPAAPSSLRHAAERARSAPVMPASGTSSWFGMLRRRLNRKGPEQSTKRRTLPEPPSAGRERGYVSVGAKRGQSGTTGELKANRRSLLPQTRAASETLPKAKGPSATPTSRWSKLLRRTTRAVLLGRLLPKPPAATPELRHDSAKAGIPNERKSPALFPAMSLERAPESRATQSGAGAAPADAEIRSTPEQPPWPGDKRRPNGSQPVRPVAPTFSSSRSVHTSAPFAAEVNFFAHQPQAVAEPDTSRYHNGRPETSPARPPHCWPPLGSLAPESQERDPWPVLPDDRHRPADGFQSFRSAEHLRALDIEQRGGH